MTPEEAIVEARRLSRPHQRYRDYAESGALRGYIEAVSRWRPGRGATLRTFACRRMHGAMIDDLRHFVGTRRRGDAFPIGDCASEVALPQEISEHERLLVYIAHKTSRKHARACWLWCCLGYTMVEVGQILGVDESRVSQIISEVKRAVA